MVVSVAAAMANRVASTRWLNNGGYGRGGCGLPATSGGLPGQRLRLAGWAR